MVPEAPTPNGERVTLRDIARRAGVSHMTVSRALRNEGSISVQRRAEILRIAREMGYEPDPFLSALVAYRSRKRAHAIQGAIAWLNAWTEPERLRQHHEFDAYWRGASETARQYGYRLEEIRWPAECSARRLRQILLTRNIRGVLFPPQSPPREWGKYDWSNVAIIRFGTSVRTPDAHVVTSDGFRSIQMAVERMRDYGYQRVGLILDVEFDGSLGGNFFGGFLAAQRRLELGACLPPLALRDVASARSEAKAAVAAWIASNRPDAILTSEPLVPALLAELGYRVPDDFALAGTSVSDIPVDAGINQNSEQIGRTAVEMLVSQINVNQRGEPRAPCRILVEGIWQDGKSLPPRK